MSRDYICLWRLIGCIMVIVAFFAWYSKTQARASTTAIKTQDVRIRIASCLVVATDRVHGGHCCVFTIATYTPIFALLHISALSVTHHYLFLKETPGACLAQDVGFGNQVMDYVNLQNEDEMLIDEQVMDFVNLQNEDEMLIDEHESQITKTGEMDDVSLNDEEAILVDQDDSNNDMDVDSLDEEDVMLIDQDDSNNDMDVDNLDEEDVMIIDQDDSNNDMDVDEEDVMLID
ncbi:uncharacterized protein EDB91DRAFT_1080645 [Suillus paluster]|uniref:uncharacterized protein n=2 Tax=Suillus paluster TaxID=48578 RepID=UPI001B885F7E|nr:uncharacterized protein EDB91DRAFT_1080645 [Suillus paluster]KAG1744531.1 hypothetical protein EDB91DRAFT_1080645 [Suillus paluster]